jgi:glycosyltransferase involved in cell wall biosynthesis
LAEGPDVAIRVAHAAKLPLRIADKLPRAENRYFNTTIKPLLDQDNVEFVAEVHDRQKHAFLGTAAALLFPIDWPEPFGLVMIEAMATGTQTRGSIATGVGVFAPDAVSTLMAAFDGAWQSILPAGPNFRISKASLRGNYLQSTSLNRLGRASLTSAVCAMAPCFTWLSQI